MILPWVLLFLPVSFPLGIYHSLCGFETSTVMSLQETTPPLLSSCGSLRMATSGCHLLLVISPDSFFLFPGGTFPRIDGIQKFQQSIFPTSLTEYDRAPAKGALHIFPFLPPVNHGGFFDILGLFCLFKHHYVDASLVNTKHSRGNGA